jgi:broad specificity phosphatase PhoE
MTPLALLRHADTAWSLEGRIQGRADVPLCDAARRRLRGRSLPEACRGMRVVTSPLARCVETAALLGAPDAAREPRIIEMDWGVWHGASLPGLRKALGQDMSENEARGLDFTPPGGESPRLVIQRLKTWLCEIGTAGVPTLAITHRGVIRAILAEASGWDMRGKPPAKLDWDAVHLFSVAADGSTTVLRLNAALPDREEP